VDGSGVSVLRPWRSTARSASAAVTMPIAVHAFAGTATFPKAMAPQCASLPVLPLEAAPSGCPDPSDGRSDVVSVAPTFS
jgi:hypothetical protein